jgi:hypothetical protein
VRRRAISLVGALGVALSLAGEALPLFDGFISPPKETYPSMWVFEVLRRLVERDFMSAADLVAVAARVEETNPYLSGITERLRCLLGFVKR